MERAGSGSSYRLLGSKPFTMACLVNITMGLLYVWSLFLVPMESHLGVARASLSLVPALSLVSFTVGMILHDRLLRALSLSSFALLAFGLAAGGHLMFAAAPTFGALLIGYGLLFGLGSGLGYGLALALVTSLPDLIRSTAVGLVMAAFAISGVVLSSLLAAPIQNADPSRSFTVIGLAVIVVGAIVAVVLRGDPGRPASARAGPSHAPSFFAGMADARFLMLGFAFFFICYTGLMIVAHATGIVAATGQSASVAGLAAGSFTLGYIIGSFFGGKLVEALTGGAALVAANVIAAAGLVILLLPGSPVLLIGTLAIGAVFGGSASLMPVLIGDQYGVARIGDIYGKLMIAYGAAGLVAPWITGQLYSGTGSYTAALVVGLAMCVGGAGLGLALQRATPRATTTAP